MFKIKTEIGAIFQLTVRKASDGSVVRTSGRFHNLVLNSGLTMMGDKNKYWGRSCFVGTGSSEPNITQTTLDNPIAKSSSMLSSNDVSNRLTKPYYAGLVTTYRFNAGVAVGNLTEVCIGDRTGSPSKYVWESWNRALIKDAKGKPTVLTVLEDEFLDVTVELRMYPTEEVTGSFRLLDRFGGVKSTHTYKGYPYIGNPSQSFGTWELYHALYYQGVLDDAVLKDPTTQVLTGSMVCTRHFATAAGVLVGNRLENTNVIGLTVGNGVPINGMLIAMAGVLSDTGQLSYKFMFEPSITKTYQEEHTWKFFIEWGRFEGGG